MPKMIPTLTPKGFVSSIADKADTALLNFYLSQYSQTNIHRGVRRPLAYLVQQFGSDGKAITDALDLELTSYLNNLFDYAEVDVDWTEEGKGIKLQLNVMIRDGDNEHSLGHVISTDNSKIIDIIDVNNTGSVLRRNPAINIS